MTVQTWAAKKSVFARRSWPAERMEARIGTSRMAPIVMAALAKKGHLSHQELAMVAPVNLMAGQAIFRHRSVFKGIGPSLFSMALITKIVYRIGLDHRLGVKAAVWIVAIVAFYPTLFDRVVWLLVRLGPDVPMAFKACLGGLDLWPTISADRVDRMAIVTRNICRFVPARIPKCQILCFSMACKAFWGFLPCINLFPEGKYRNPFSSTLFNMLGTRTMAGLTPLTVCRTIGYCLFAMDGFYKVIVLGFMAFLTNLRADISLLRPDAACHNENKKKKQRNW
jgi:hypothetical protein